MIAHEGFQPAAAIPRDCAILVVDDDQDVCSYLQVALQTVGARTTVCHNTAEALAVCRKSTIDIILSDVNMPGKNGTELVTILAQEYPQTIRVLMTASLDLAVFRDLSCREIIHGLCLKPIGLARLQSSAREWMKQCPIQVSRVIKPSC